MLIYQKQLSYNILCTFDSEMNGIGLKRFQKTSELHYNVRHSILPFSHVASLHELLQSELHYNDTPYLYKLMTL